VREVAVVARRNAEDPQPVEADADDHRFKRHAGPEHRQTRDMNEHERNGGGIDDVIVLVAALVLTWQSGGLPSRSYIYNASGLTRLRRPAKVVATRLSAVAARPAVRRRTAKLLAAHGGTRR
jgi:hypothetical protein